MSDIGVHANVYQRVREFGQLIDDVLVGLRSHTSASDPARRRLGELLVGVSKIPPPDLPTAWLAMLIGGPDPAARGDWARIGRSLLGSGSSELDVLAKLEDLAERLESTRTDALAKMRGIRT